MISSLKIGSQTLTWGTRTYVMGIINLTPDSFSGDGLLAAHPAEAAQAGLDLARRFLEAGADILDIGAESTRPGALPVGAEEETSRLVPLIRLLRAELPEALISVDTYKAAVADASLGAGAHLLNDV